MMHIYMHISNLGCIALKGDASFRAPHRVAHGFHWDHTTAQGLLCPAVVLAPQASTTNPPTH